MRKSSCVAWNLVRLGRPYYVLPAMAAVLAGYMSGSGDHALSIGSGTVCLVFGLLGMACWTANEVADRDSDSRGQPKSLWGIYVSGGTGLLSSGLVSVKAAVAFTVMLSSAGLIAAASVGFAFAGLSVAFLLIGLAYSLKPLRLKARGVVGLAAVAMAYGVVAFSAGWTAVGDRPLADGLAFACMLSIAFFGFEGLAHLLDHEHDQQSGQATAAVSLGEQKARALLACCQCLPALALLFIGRLGWIGMPSVCWLMLVPLLLASATGAIVTATCEKRMLAYLRVLSVPFISAFAFLLL